MIFHYTAPYPRFHNQPPPPGPDDSGPVAESNNSTTGADEKPSDNGEEENEKTRHSPNNSPIKSDPVQQQQNYADVAANNSGGGRVISTADFQKLQSMIMELNGSSSSAAVASAGRQSDGVRSDSHPAHHRPFSTCAATSSSQNTASDSPTTKCCPTAS